MINPQCLIDCFNNPTSSGTPHPPKSAPTNPNHCVHHLLYDLGVGGICANKFASAINIQVNPDCTFDPTGSVILNGTCSTETEKLLLNSACKRDIFEQPGFIVNTILLLIVSSCKGTVSQDYLEFCQEAKCELFSGDIPGIPRLHGPEVVAELDNYTLVTKLNYANTRHRYPWVCSLRTLGSNPDHLCAVTLLSVPPKPTVVVSAAHCTYLCKNSKGAMVSSCCCDDGPRNCAEQEEKCGTNPKVFEMSGRDAKIVCGEWETGSVPKDISLEEYNIILEIEEIIRHPSFNTSKGAGPLMGGDIAVFKVFDSKLKTETIKKYKLYPSCLPKIANERKTGIHTGWAKPPPFHFLERRTPGFLRFYRDYFTQWHYKMSILPKCKDPLTDPLTGQQLVGPTNTFYPAGTVCAREVTSRSCFSTGDSGSPLLVSMKGSQSRFYTEGILSFTKGCDFLILQTDVLTVSEFDFGSKPKWILNQVTENPSVYTKLSCYLPWIAAMYNMDYETSQVVDPECYQAQGVQVDQNQKECITKYSDLTAQIDGEVPCIFPYYFNGVKYDQCYAFEFEGFLYPQFFCPVRNITTKKLGINSFEKSDVILPGLCLSDQSDPLSPLDPEKQDCTLSQRRIPYSFCKNDCVGGEYRTFVPELSPTETKETSNSSHFIFLVSPTITSGLIFEPMTILARSYI